MQPVGSLLRIKRSAASFAPSDQTTAPPVGELASLSLSSGVALALAVANVRLAMRVAVPLAIVAAAAAATWARDGDLLRSLIIKQLLQSKNGYGSS